MEVFQTEKSYFVFLILFSLSLFYRYCEVISQLVSKASMSYPVEFLSQVYELASRLKYHDLHYQMCKGELLEMPDPKWLSHLHELLETTKHKEKINSTEDDQDYAETSVSQNILVDNYYHQAPSASVEGNEGPYYQDIITDEYHQGSHGSYRGHITTADRVDGGQQNCLPPLSPPSTDGLEMPSKQNEVHQLSDGTSQPTVTCLSLAKYMHFYFILIIFVKA